MIKIHLDTEAIHVLERFHPTLIPLGENEEISDAALRALKPRQDSAVITIGRIVLLGSVGSDAVGGGHSNPARQLLYGG